MFPTHVRALGVGLPYALTVSIFGGTAEPVALWFKASGHERWFYYYLTGLIAVSLVVYIAMRDTRRQSAMALGNDQVPGDHRVGNSHPEHTPAAAASQPLPSLH